MAYQQYSKKGLGCFKCGNVGHIAEQCTSEHRLCYNCRQPGHESNACEKPRTVETKQCYFCLGVGHIQADCPTARIQGNNQKCYSCGRFGHISRLCPTGAGANGGFAARAPGGGRSLNTAALPPIKCYRCGGLNHMSKDCLAPPGTSVSDQVVVSTVPMGNANRSKRCYTCEQEGHIARDCPQREVAA